MKDSMNHALLVSAVLPVLLVSVLVASRDAGAQTTLGAVSMQGSASVGIFPQPVPDTNVAKYREYSDLAQQVIAPELHLLLGDKSDDRVFADFRSYNLGQNNQMYNLHTGSMACSISKFSTSICRTTLATMSARLRLVRTVATSA
jgi:hypothetical protein